MVSDAIQVAGFIWRGTVVWDKTQGVRPYKGRFRHQAEYVLWGSKGPLPKPAKDAPVVPGVLQCSPQRGERLHQVHKPEEVMKQLIRIVPPGGNILDPFAGSGTTLIEAARAGHQATGIELSEHYHQVAADRIKKENRR